MSEDERRVVVVDRFPTKMFGDSPTAQIAAKVLKVLEENPARPAESLASLMVVAYLLQEGEVWGRSPEETERMRSEALVIADGMQVVVKFRKGKDEDGE